MRFLQSRIWFQYEAGGQCFALRIAYQIIKLQIYLKFFTKSNFRTSTIDLAFINSELASQFLTGGDLAVVVFIENGDRHPCVCHVWKQCVPT